MLEHRFTHSSAVEWCRYDRAARTLDVCFVRSAVYRYHEVPIDIVEQFVSASSAGRFLHAHIASRFSVKQGADTLPPPSKADARVPQLAEKSYQNVRGFIPASWHDPVRQVLTTAPMLVHVVRKRKTKHGDHRVKNSHSVITVNDSGNCWQFVITLLHEIAHAHVAHGVPHKVSPHGREWKSAFRMLLISHVQYFPQELVPAVINYARNPLFSSGSHSGLANALSRYETADRRAMVQELRAGQLFSLNGERIFIKGQLVRSRYRCKSKDGRVFLISGTARVKLVDGMAD